MNAFGNLLNQIVKNNTSPRSFLIKHFKIIWNHFIPYRIKKNVYHTNYKKRAIICYMIRPFLLKGANESAPNIEWSRIIAKQISELGYNVDIVEWNTNKKIKLTQYELAFGFGKQFDRCLRSELIKYKFPFLTGASPYYSNVAEQKRNVEFTRRNNEAMPFILRRQVPINGGLMDLAALRNATAAFYLGNDWVKNTYEFMVENLIELPNVGCGNVSFKAIHRNVEEAKYNFLWFGGIGMMHKGLDLCIEAFRQFQNCTLFVAGSKDDDVFDYYRGDFENGNVQYLGFIDVNSDEYKSICEKCLFSILPSCSEAGCSSVLTTMKSGMIPIISKECGIDVFDFGYILKENTVEEITKTIDLAIEITEEKANVMQANTSAYVEHKHTYLAFEKAIKSSLTNFVGY